MISLLEDISSYAEAHTKVAAETVLAELERITHLRVLSPQMLSGKLQGQWLAFLSQMLRPKLIVEVGTFTGYSAICLAQGLTPDGTLHTIELDEELAPIIREFVQKAGLQERIQLHLGDANQIVPTLPDSIDLAFIDADKQSYSNYYDLLFPKIKMGGYLLIDNVLWHGKVLEKHQDAKTKSIVALNQKIQQDTRVQNVLLPIRDGILCVKKIRD